MSRYGLAEPPPQSIRTLEHFLKSAGELDRELLMFDLVDKLRDLPSHGERYTVLLRTLGYLFYRDHPDYLAFLSRNAPPYDSGESSVRVERRKVDVAFLTIMRTELNGAKRAFDISKSKQPTQEVDARKYWEFRLRRQKEGERKLRCVLSMAGERKEAACITTCHKLLQLYEVGLFVLIGVAAGVKDLVELGDVVCPDRILQTGHTVAQPGGLHRRTTPELMSPRLRREIEAFDPTGTTCIERLSSCEIDLPAGVVRRALPRFLDRKILLSSSTYRADGSLPNLREEIDADTRGADQESWAFARTCSEERVPWIVFRGISDFGDPDTTQSTRPHHFTTSKQWQPYATRVAACFGRSFVEAEYEPL